MVMVIVIVIVLVRVSLCGCTECEIPPVRGSNHQTTTRTPEQTRSLKI